MVLSNKAILFDVDGTLVDNMAVHIQAWIDYLKGYGVIYTPEQVFKTVNGKTSTEVIRGIFPDLSDEEVNRHTHEKESIYMRNYDSVIREIAGLTSFLQQTQSMGIKMAIASAGGINVVQFVLNKLNISSYFGAVVSAQDIKNSKPDPEIFLLAAQRLGTKPQNCLVIEDSIAGLKGAHRAGMKSVAITTSHSVEELREQSSVIKVIGDYCQLNAHSLFDLAADITLN